MKKSVVVTGNLGYLGPIVVRNLRERGYVVAGVDPQLYPANLQWNYKPEIQVGNIEQLPRAFWNPLAVLHLAAISNDPMAELDERLTYDTNVRLVAEVADMFPDARHILASSASVYGFNPENCIESSPVNPLSTYASSKIAAENILNLLNPMSISLRFGTLWGASPNFRIDLAINHFALEAVMHNKIVPMSNARRPILHVEDAAKALVDAVEARSETHHGIYNIVAENVEIFDAAARVGEATGAEVVVDSQKKDADGRSYFSGTIRDPHLVPRQAISLGDKVAMSQLTKCALDNFKTPPRIEALKALLARANETQ